MKQRQEIHCHACDKWVQFEIDLELDGNHILNCPNCNHEHCRVVKNGQITDIRWDQRNGPTHNVTYVTSTSSATITYSVGYTDWFLANSWASTGT